MFITRKSSYQDFKTFVCSIAHPRRDLCMPQKQTRRSTSHLIPVLVLIVLAPTSAEILLGNLLLNSTFVPTLLMYLLLYGSGALLIREITRRLHLGWPS